ncbi:DNA primase [Candidatus Acetothermia bacterium]|nr:DNA primase [Candidatus Acetothermia bacterium]
MATPDEIALVRERAEIVNLVSRYVSVRKAGKNFVALCPFHPDKNPSMTVSPEKNLFHCFACGEGGDIFKFLMKIENLSFPEAVEKIAAEVGVKLSRAERSAPSKFDAYKELNEKICQHFQKNLFNSAGQKAFEYLKHRGFLIETMKKFRLGYSMGAWDDLLRNFPKDKELLNTLGLTVPSKESHSYDRFRDRLIFPIFSGQGDVIGFAGRALSEADEPKYLNISNTPLFEKGHVLYGLNFARNTASEQKCFVMVEGYADVIAAHQANFTNVVASMGTALTSEQARLIKRYAPLVILAYDRDAAGQAATWRGIRNLSNEGLDVEIALLPVDEDPDNFIKTKGPDAFRKILDDARPFHQFYVQYLIETNNAHSGAGKQKILQEAIAFIKGIVNSARRHEMIRELASQVSIPDEEIALLVRNAPDASKTASATERTTTTQTTPQSRPILQNQISLGPEEHLLYFLFQGHLSVPRVARALEATQFVKYPEIARVLYEVGSQERWKLDQLLEQLSPDDQTIVRGLMLTELNFSSVDKAIADAMTQIKLKYLEEHLRKLNTQIAQAERSGDKEIVKQLQAKIIANRKEQSILKRLQEGGI